MTWQVRVGIAAALAALLLFVLILDGSDGDSERTAGSSEPGAEALTLTEYDLLTRARTVEPTAYWIGPRTGTDRFELERDPDGNIFLRYPGGDAETADSQSGSLTIASYPVDEAQRSLERAARAEGDPLVEGDGYVTFGSADSYSAYVVFEERPELQIEVYSPHRGEAAQLVAAGVLTPLHWTPLG